MCTFAPPLQAGVHLTRDGNNLRLATSLRNLSSKPVVVESPDGMLFHVKIEERTFSEDGKRYLWSPGKGTIQAFTSWRIEGDGTATQHYEIPSREQARERAQTLVSENSLWDEGDIETVMGPWVDIDEAGVLVVSLEYPGGDRYRPMITRKYDLRTNPERVLDDSIPPESMEAIQRR